MLFWYTADSHLHVIQINPERLPQCVYVYVCTRVCVCVCVCVCVRPNGNLATLSGKQVHFFETRKHQNNYAQRSDQRINISYEHELLELSRNQ